MLTNPIVADYEVMTCRPWDTTELRSKLVQLIEPVSVTEGTDAALQWRCKLCGRHFRMKSHAEGHAVTHTGDRQYHCEMCDKRFVRMFHLKRHMKTVHKVILTTAW